MATDAQIKDYMSSMLPTAQKVAGALGIPANLIASWWSFETDAGTNLGAKSNNEAGVGYNSDADYRIQGGYGGYNSLDRFANAYTKVLQQNAFGYPSVLAVARKDPTDLAGITNALNASSYSEGDYPTSEIVRRAGMVSVAPASSSVGTDFLASIRNSINNVSTMNHDELIKFAGIGAVAVLLIALAND